jgi:ABC-2 type transport system permease protein
MTTSTSRSPATPASLLLASGPRPRDAGAAGASLVFAWRALLKIKHVPQQLGDVIGIPILFTLMFTYLFGGAIAGSTTEYLQHLLPGTLVLAVLLVTVYTGATLNADVTSGVSDRFRSLPIWRPAILLGAMIGDVGRYLIASSLVLGLGLIMGFSPAGGPAAVLASIGLVLVFAVALGWMWAALGLVMPNPTAVMSTGFLVFFPLTFASNVFVDPATTPSWLTTFIEINPVSHLVTAVRGLMAGSVTTGQVGYVLITSIALVAVLAPLTMRLHRTRV